MSDRMLPLTLDRWIAYIDFDTTPFAVKTSAPANFRLPLGPAMECYPALDSMYYCETVIRKGGCGPCCGAARDVIGLGADRGHLSRSYYQTKRRFMSKRLLIAFASTVLLVIAVSGCNTVRGAGEDVQSVGAAMTGD